MPSETEVIEKRKRAAENWAVRSRNYRRARERALTALARRYKEDYLALLEEEKAKDEQEGKRWRNLAGSDDLADVASATDSTSTDRRDTSTPQAYESDNE